MTEYDNPELETEPTVDDALDENDFLVQLKQSQSQKKIDLVTEIEERIELIAERTAKKLVQLCQENVKVTFREMSMFQRLSAIDNGSKDYSLLFVEDEGLPVVVYLMEHTLYRNLLSYTLAGSDKHAQEQRELSASEQKLFLLFADHMASAIFENMEVIPLNGMPDGARYLSREEMLEISDEAELVAFVLDVKFGTVEGSFVLMSPLALFEKSEPAQFGAEQNALAEKEEWRQVLQERLDDVPVPVTIELGSRELHLSEVTSLRVGQRLDLHINPAKITAYSSHEEEILKGGLALHGNSIRFQVESGSE